MIVLDASALLAYLFRETGQAIGKKHLESEFIKNHQPTQKRDVRDLVGKVEIAPDF